VRTFLKKDNIFIILVGEGLAPPDKICTKSRVAGDVDPYEHAEIFAIYLCEKRAIDNRPYKRTKITANTAGGIPYAPVK
jgi:hypothetical protein